MPGMEPSGLQMCVPHPPQTTHIVSAMVRELMAAAVGDLLEAGKEIKGIYNEVMRCTRSCQSMANDYTVRPTQAQTKSCGEGMCQRSWGNAIG